MAETVKGIVTAKYEKSGKTNKGGFYTNVRLEIDNGQTYGGFVDVKNKEVLAAVAEGDRVALKVEQNGKYWNFSNVKILEKGAMKVAPSIIANSGDTREYAMSVGKATGLVQALVQAKVYKTDDEVKEKVKEFSKFIHDVVLAGYSPEKQEDKPEPEEGEKDEENWDE